MLVAVRILQYVIASSFLVIGMLAFREWRRTRAREQLLISLAVGLVGAVSLIAKIRVESGWASRLITDLTVAGLLASAWALMEFRHTIVPLAARARRLVHIALGVVYLPVLFTRLPRVSHSQISRPEFVVGWAVVLVWMGCMVEPAFRLGRFARSRPPIQRMRLRLLSASYLGIFFVLAAAIAAPDQQANVYRIVVSAAILPIMPLLYGALAPPKWLRKRWTDRDVARERERMLLTMPAIVWTTDAELRITSTHGSAAPEVARAIGRSIGDLYQQYGMDQTPAAQLALEMHKRALAGEAVTFDTTIKGKSYQSKIEPVMGANGRVAGTVGLSVEITERVRAEEATKAAFEREHQAAEHLRALDEMKNGFMSAVSHELRTPLAGVVGFASTLQREDRLTPEDRRAVIARLVANANKLERLLGDLLDLDRLTRGIMEPLRRHTDVGALARHVVDEWRMEAARPVHLNVEPVTAFVDGPKVERIIENLLANAAKYTPAGSPVWVTVRPLNDGVSIVVEDAGPGIPLEVRASMFEPFRRGAEHVGHAPGFGIGLSLVSRFATLHDGTVSVGDRAGGGARFEVYLPGNDVERRKAGRPWRGAALEEPATAAP